MPVSLLFALLGLIVGLVMVRSIKGIKGRFQMMALLVAFAAAVALAAALFAQG